MIRSPLWTSMFGLICMSLILQPGCAPNGPKRNAVTGIVLVDGIPAERVVVQFSCQDVAGVTGDDKYPSALTDANGQFVLGKGSRLEGAVDGEYVVTFSWMSGPELEAVDKFKGMLGDPAKSKHRIRVPEDTQKPLEFKLENPAPKKS
jgi:hypothetical protein